MNKRRFLIAACMIVVGAFLLYAAGCGSSSGSTDEANWSDGGVTEGGGFSVSGRVTEVDSRTAVAGAACTLEEVAGRGRAYSATTTTNGSGEYIFPDVPAGYYVIVVTTPGYVTTRYYITVTGATVTDIPVVSAANWNNYMGDEGHAYEDTAGYLIIRAETQDQSAGRAPLSGVAIESTPADYQDRGYINSGAVDWNATSTYADGQAFFYRVDPGQSYRVSAAKDGFTFQDLTGVSPIAGEIVVHSMTGVPQGNVLSSIAVTPTGAALLIGEEQQFIATGDFGGYTQDITGQSQWDNDNAAAGAFDPQTAGLYKAGVVTGEEIAHITASLDGVTSGQSAVTVNLPPAPIIDTVSPDNGPEGMEVTITGQNFGAEPGTSTVTFNGTAASVFNSWSDTEIKCEVPSGTTTGPVIVTVYGQASNSDKTFSAYEYFVYATNFGSNTITSFSIGSDGTLTSLGTTASGGLGPYGIEAHPTGGFVYATNYNNQRISTYSIGATGLLTHSGTIVTGGNIPWRIAVHPAGYLYNTNMVSNTVTRYSIGGTGLLTNLGVTVPAGGNNMQAIAVHPVGYLYVGNRNSHNIFTFSGAETGAITLTGTSTPVANSFPEGMVINPDGYLYVSYWGQSTVAAFSGADTGALVSLGTTGTGGGGPSDLAYHPAGYVYAVNEGTHDVSAFSIGATGALTLIGTPTGTGVANSRPRGIEVYQEKNYVYAANWNTGNVSAFSVGADGSLTLIGAPVATGGSNTYDVTVGRRELTAP